MISEKREEFTSRFLFKFCLYFVQPIYKILDNFTLIFAIVLIVIFSTKTFYLIDSFELRCLWFVIDMLKLIKL
jgi:hypothetical protein